MKERERFEKGAAIRHQGGAALVVALLLLLVMTLLGVAGLNTGVLEEKMSAASYDRNLALQAAEVALREGEQLAESNASEVPPAYADPTADCATLMNECTDGLCPPPAASCGKRWTDAAFTGWKDADANLPAIVGAKPQFFVEFLGANFPCRDGGSSDPNNCRRYRVTARAQPGTGRALVMVQSLYGTE